MASIAVNAAGFEAELDIPTDIELLECQRREYMRRACHRRLQQMASDANQHDPSKMAALGALIDAIEAHFSELLEVKITEA